MDALWLLTLWLKTVLRNQTPSMLEHLQRQYVKLKNGQIKMMMKKYIRPILTAIGYYKIKAKWRWRQNLAQWQKIDAQRKAEAIAWIEAIDHRLLPDVQKIGNVTVSLTSHSKRVSDFAPFAIYSIFHQTVLPNRIVLNINQEKWNDDNLPELIQKLQIAGLEVNLCEDTGPHTKLLPALEKYPDDVIITVDDDVYYEDCLIADLLADYRQKNEPCVICKSALVVGVQDEEILPYSKWKMATPENSLSDHISPHGFCGVLYAPHIFSKEVFNKPVYQKCAKYADDIWFTVIEIKEHIPAYLSSKPNHDMVEVDHYNEYVAQNSDALHFGNAEGGRNDEQLAALVEYYHLNELVS